MYLLLKMGISIAMLGYQRVQVPGSLVYFKNLTVGKCMLAPELTTAQR